MGPEGPQDKNKREKREEKTEERKEKRREKRKKREKKKEVRKETRASTPLLYTFWEPKMWTGRQRVLLTITGLGPSFFSTKIHAG